MASDRQSRYIALVMDDTRKHLNRLNGRVPVATAINIVADALVEMLTSVTAALSAHEQRIDALEARLKESK